MPAKEPLFDVLISGQDASGRKTIGSKAFLNHSRRTPDKYLVRYLFEDDGAGEGGRNIVRAQTFFLIIIL